MATARRELHSDIAVSATCGWVEQSLLEPLGLGLRDRVVLEVGGEVDEQLVERPAHVVLGVAADVGEPLERLGVDLAGHEVVDGGRHPGRGALGDERLEEVLVVDEPGAHLVEGEVDETDVGLVADHLVEQPARHRAHRLLDEPGQHGLLDDGPHVLVGDAVQGVHRDRGDLVDEPLGVPGHEGPLGGPTGRLGVEDALADDVLVHEVLADELLEAAPDHLLLARDERGVRDRQAERVAEDRGDGEPVGAGTDHRGLGAGVDEAEHAVVMAAGQHVDDGGEDEQPGGDEPHPTQVAAALGVERRVDHEAEGTAGHLRAGRGGHVGCRRGGIHGRHLSCRCGVVLSAPPPARRSAHRSSHGSRHRSRCAPRCGWRSPRPRRHRGRARRREHDAQHPGAGRLARLDPVAGDLRLVGDGGTDRGATWSSRWLGSHGRCWARAQSMLGRSTVAWARRRRRRARGTPPRSPPGLRPRPSPARAGAWASHAARLSSEVKTGRAREPSGEVSVTAAMSLRVSTTWAPEASTSSATATTGTSQRAAATRDSSSASVSGAGRSCAAVSAATRTGSAPPVSPAKPCDGIDLPAQAWPAESVGSSLTGSACRRRRGPPAA